MVPRILNEQEQRPKPPGGSSTGTSRRAAMESAAETVVLIACRFMEASKDTTTPLNFKEALRLAIKLRRAESVVRAV